MQFFNTMLKNLLKSFWARLMIPVGILAFIVICIGATTYALIAKNWEENRIAVKVEQTTSSNLKVLGVINSMLDERVHGGMRLLMDKSASIGAPTIDANVSVDGKAIPNLKFGSRPQTGHYELVDSVTRAVGGTQTLFARVGDDFVRVSTNVIRDNERAIGTVLEHDSKAYDAIRQGTAYYGIVYILGEPYLAGYEPMIGKNGSVVGIWYVGFRVDMQLLRDLAAHSDIPGDGFIAALDSHGNPHFYSPHITAEKAREMNSNDEPGWHVIRKKFEPWNFSLIAAYPKDAAGISVMYRVLILFTIFMTGGLIVFLALVFLLKKWVLTPLGGRPLEIARCLDAIVNNDDEVVEISLKRGDKSSIMAMLHALQQKYRNILTPLYRNAGEITGQIRDVETAAKKLLEDRSDESLINLQAQLRVLRRTAGILDMSVERIPPSWVQDGHGSYTYKNKQDNNTTSE
jgi:methyl-accepting chemotaxis protein